MNKRNKKLVPAVFALSTLIFILIVFFTINPKFEEYQEAQIKNSKINVDRENLEDQITKIKAEQEQEDIKMQSLKTVYKSEIESSNDNLGMFGSMFDDIIKLAQNNSLLIRSIEYDMRPETDPIYAENSDSYNVCELKFFFVGTYSQLGAFLADINNRFQYLVYVSKLDVTAFASNTDYLLINSSITLYSKKPDSEAAANKNSRARKKQPL